MNRRLWRGRMWLSLHKYIKRSRQNFRPAARVAKAHGRSLARMSILAIIPSPLAMTVLYFGPDVVVVRDETS